MARHTRPRALTVAGSDSGGGAGIQADLKTFHSFGVFGMSAVTAVTVQNTVGVADVYPVPPAVVAQQMRAVVEDIGVDALKTGMLVDATTVATVAGELRELADEGLLRGRGAGAPIHLVVDPVMYAKGGEPLLAPSARDVLISELLPLAEVLTPNVPEAELLAGMAIESEEERERAARRIQKLTGHWVLLKGGHLASEQAVDLLCDREQMLRLSAPRFDTVQTHGTGCTFSAALTAGLARGYDVPTSAQLAKEYVTAAIRAAMAAPLGHGHGPTDHTVTGRWSPGSGGTAAIETGWAGGDRHA